MLSEAVENSKPKCNGSNKQGMNASSQEEGRVASPPLPSTSYLGKRNAEALTKDKNGEKEKTVELKAHLTHLKGQSAQVNKVAKFDQLSSTRPSNPFAKAVTNQQSSSLFDSLKKTNKGTL